MSMTLSDNFPFCTQTSCKLQKASLDTEEEVRRSETIAAYEKSLEETNTLAFKPYRTK